MRRSYNPDGNSSRERDIKRPVTDRSECCGATGGCHLLGRWSSLRPQHSRTIRNSAALRSPSNDEYNPSIPVSVVVGMLTILHKYSVYRRDSSSDRLQRCVLHARSFLFLFFFSLPGKDHKIPARFISEQQPLQHTCSLRYATVVLASLCSRSPFPPSSPPPLPRSLPPPALCLSLSSSLKMIYRCLSAFGPGDRTIP